MLTLVGTIEKKGFGFGVWALVTEEGTVYELQDPPPDLCQSGKRVKVLATIQKDVMTLAMIGPVLKVESFSLL